MKKYLITVALAVLVSGAFIGCKEDDFSGSKIEQKVQAFEEAFVRAFGQPNPNHTWGFEELDGDNQNGTDFAMTRADGAFANHIGAYPDANMWTSKGFLAPDPLTQSQKLRAQYYFQMNCIVNPNRPNYGTKDFFVQQVYDGGTDPMTGKSAEKYLAANGSTLIESGEHMDHLTAGPGHLHIYNFNNGTCSTNNEVADRNQTSVNNTNQQHSDEIMLMLNTPTSCFGYANSDASYVRDDRWTLVSAAAIDEFCDNDPGFSAWLAERLTDERGDVKCDDDFHRDYIGFDFDMIPDELCYAYNGYDSNGNQTWNADQVVRKEFIYAQYGTLNEANDQRVFNEDGTVSPYASWNTEIIIDSNKIPYVITNTNMYCAIGDHANIGIGGQDGFNDYATIGHYVAGGANDNTLYLDNLPNEQSDKKAINMKFIAKLVRKGYLPVADKNLKRWVKIGGCNDGYFSDWIVTFMPANSGTITPDAPQVYEIGTNNQEQKIEIYKSKKVKQAGRVFCEDLTNRDLDDFDYNDIVFDVIIVDEITKTVITPVDGNRLNDGTPVETYTHEYYANVRLMAAGGTIPASIEIGEHNFDVHLWLGKQSHTTMINTLSKDERDKVRGAVVASVDPVDLTWGDGNQNFYGIEKISDIKVYVKYDNDATQLIPEKGKASPIFVVPLGTRWPKERSNIGKAYKQFENWVSDATCEFWNGSTDEDMLHADLSGFTTGKDYVISPEEPVEGYPIYETISSTTSKHLVPATNNTMVVPGSGETVLKGYDPQNPGYLCRATTTDPIMTVSVPGNSNIQEGDIIRIYGVSISGWAISTNLTNNFTSTNYPSGGYIEFEVQHSFLDRVKTTGFTISGEKFTVTYVTVRRPN